MKNIILLLTAFIGYLVSAQTPPTEPLMEAQAVEAVQGMEKEMVATETTMGVMAPDLLTRTETL